MASSGKSLKSRLKQSPLFAASMEAVLCFLSFSLATKTSLALVPILLVESGRVPHAGFFSPMV